MEDETVVIVVAEPSHPAVNKLPSQMPNVRFVIFPPSLAESNKSSMEFESSTAVVWMPPSDPKALVSLWSLLKNTPPTWMHSLSAGVDMIGGFIKSHLLESSTVLTNGRGAFSSSLAEYVIASALHFNKQVERLQANKKAHKWDNFQMPVLRNKTMGFLGFGDIPKATAKIAKTFGMRVIALRRNTSKSEADSDLVDVTYNMQTEKLKLFQEADFVVAVLPGTPETENFVGAAELAAMKPSGVLISIGRGMTIDEDALMAALQSKQIAGAALDVYKQEPLPSDHPLWDCDNLLMSSHNADLTEDYFELAWNVWAENFEAFRSGKEMVTPVDKSAGY